MPRYLVHHNYGMGGLMWFVDAPSEAEIVRTFAETTVISRDEWDVGLSEEGTWQIDDGSGVSRAINVQIVDIDGIPSGHPLDDLRTLRRRQEQHPLHAKLLAGETVSVRSVFDQGPPTGEVTSYYEIEPPDRRTRQVDLNPDGTRTRTSSFTLNPGFDLSIPEAMFERVEADEFERLWRSATDEK